MKIYTTYGVRMHTTNAKVLEETVHKYKEAVKFFVDIIDKCWDMLSVYESSHNAVAPVERLTISTSRNPQPKYDFSKQFHKFPCYMRRAAIIESYGIISSYHSILFNWENADKKTRGKRPSFPSVGEVCPAMYRDNCFVRTGTYTARIKVWIHNTWDWLDVSFRKTDADYIQHHCQSRKECVPTLIKRGKNWELVFAFEENKKLQTVPVDKRRIVAVDLGINNAATCCIMEPDGTVIGRRFLRLSRENDSLNHALQRVKRAQRSGARHMPMLWARVNGINENISAKTASFIEETAIRYDADVVVMEHLDLQGKKKGRSMRQRLALWKAKHVQALVEQKSHRNGMRFATVCAWNTSRLAFDGSGIVLRGNKSTKTHGSYSVCEFQSGKVYNCDLNASYNIGARYYIREILGSMPERARLALEAKVPLASKRSTCTLSTLYDLRAAMSEKTRGCAERTMSGEARDSDAPKGQPLTDA